jgi:hypothetical protein
MSRRHGNGLGDGGWMVDCLRFLGRLGRSFDDFGRFDCGFDLLFRLVWYA